MKTFKKIFLFLLVFGILSQSDAYTQKTIKILAIGNSFSVDAAEAYLDDLAVAADIDMIIGNCEIGGCSLERHWETVKADSALYAYRKIVNGDSSLFLNQTLKHCLQDEDWDYVTLQQVSYNAGRYDTYFPYIEDLMDYIKQNVSDSNVKFALHQTWAYAANSTHPGFINYENDQVKMYLAVTSTIKKVSEQTGIKKIIPSGTAIQNGRNTFIGDNFCRDGFHLSLDLGRYTAACVWFGELTGKSVKNNEFKPEGVSDEDAEIARLSAHYAVKQPFQITVKSLSE